MIHNFTELCGLEPSDVGFLTAVEAAMPILADLFRADLLLYCAGNQPNTALVVAEAKPHTVLPLHPEPLRGHQVGRKTMPAVFQVLAPRRLAPGVGSVLVHDDLVVREVVPVRTPDGRILGALSIETNVHELKRLQRKNPVFRKALLQFRSMALVGEMAAAAKLKPMGEHDAPLVVDAQGRIRYMSGIAENLYRKLGFAENLIGKNLAEIHTSEEVVFQAMATCQCLEEEVNEQGQVWMKKAIPLQGEVGTWFASRGGLRAGCTGALVIIQDVTEQRQREQAIKIKSTMIKEIHHRVKNNLQTIAALLRMQARRSDSIEVRQSLQEGVSRILSIAVVHEFLAHDEGSVLNIKDLCQQILTEVTQAILDPNKRIKLRLEGCDLFLPTQQATSCALIVNELLQNALEHGFADKDSGEIMVSLLDLGDHMQIEIADDGAGLPETFDLEQARSLGLQIIRSLVTEDLRGTFELINGRGVRARVILPKAIVVER